MWLTFHQTILLTSTKQTNFSDVSMSSVFPGRKSILLFGDVNPLVFRISFFMTPFHQAFHGYPIREIFPWVINVKFVQQVHQGQIQWGWIGWPATPLQRSPLLRYVLDLVSQSINQSSRALGRQYVHCVSESVCTL